MTTINIADRVGWLTYSISSIDERGRVGSCYATRSVFSGMLKFEVHCCKTKSVVLSKQLEDFEIDVWAFSWWQDRREFSLVDREREATVGTYLDQNKNVSYMRAHQVLDASNKGARRVANYMVGGVRSPSIDPKEIAVPPFHDPDVVKFFCNELYALMDLRKFEPLTLEYHPKPQFVKKSSGESLLGIGDPKSLSQASPLPKRAKNSE